MSDEAIVVENVGMSDELQRDAIEAAIGGIDRFDEENAIATYIRVDISSKHPSNWGCIVNNSPENPSPLNTSIYICFIYQQYTVHLWIENENSQKNSEENSEKTVSSLSKSDITNLFKKYDKSGNGKLDFDEFLNFMKDGLKFEEDKNFTKQMRFLFDAMDIDGSHNLDQNEVIECITKWKEGNFKWISKMIFRGADINRSKKVSIEELKRACNNLGKSFNIDDFEKQCKLEFGSKKKELEYWEFYKIISGETIDKNSNDADPYDGKLQTESKCCLLI